MKSAEQIITIMKSKKETLDSFKKVINDCGMYNPSDVVQIWQDWIQNTIDFIKEE